MNLSAALTMGLSWPSLPRIRAMAGVLRENRMPGFFHP